MKIFSIFLLVLFSYAYWLEPVWIEVTHHILPADIKNKLRIAHLTDLHIRSLGYREEKIRIILEKEAPDVILVSGDSISENANYREAGNFLRTLQAPLGVWLVNGNWEHWRPSREESEAFNASGIRLLNNSAEKLTDGVWLVGIDDELAGNPDLKKAFRNVPDNAFKIGLFHSPTFFDRSYSHFNIALAGHTHGGQIRLPFLPPLWLPEGSGRFVAGWYPKGNSKMYVSRGLGNSIFDVRFLCRPELPIIELGL